MLMLLAIAFQTTVTREAEAQTTPKEILVDGSPWKGSWVTKTRERKVRLKFVSGKDGEFTATFNEQPAFYPKVDGKKITLKAKRKRGKILEFSLTLDNNRLSGYVEYFGKKGMKERYITLDPKQY